MKKLSYFLILLLIANFVAKTSFSQVLKEDTKAVMIESVSCTDIEVETNNSNSILKSEPVLPGINYYNPQAYRGIMVSGVKSVGPAPSDYLTITAALTDITTNFLDGAVYLELKSDYVSTVETFPLTFGASLPTTATYTITIRPQTGATGLSITSSADQTIYLNGGKYISFDGRPGGLGTISQLTIENTSFTGTAFTFINDAQFNTIQYNTIKGVNNSTLPGYLGQDSLILGGVIAFSTSTGTTGNSNNSISNCTIQDGATTPASLIYSFGTSLAPNINNSVQNCNLLNWFYTTAVNIAPTGAIYISSGNSAWTISGNSLYQTSTRTYLNTAASTVAFIYINNSTGFNYAINNNFIGGSAPNCGGSPTNWTATTGLPTFRGIYFLAGAGTASTISGNTIANISMTSASATSPALLVHVGGDANITGNTFGSQTTTGNITYTNSGTSPSTMFFGFFGSGATTFCNFSNNTVGGITVSASSTGSVQLRTVYTQVSGSAITINFNNNIIGGTVANSIQQNTSQTTYGLLSISTSANQTLTENTIQNLTQNNTGTGSLQGIWTQSTSTGKFTVTGNIIKNLTTYSTNNFFGNGASIGGIQCYYTTNNNHIFFGNQIHNLVNNNTTAAGLIYGICIVPVTNVLTTPVEVSKNFIHSFTSASVTSSQIGIYNFNSVGTGPSYYANNIIRLGIDASGASLTNSVKIVGFYKANTSNVGLYFNSIYIGGSGVSSNAVNTYGYYRYMGSTGDTVMNNIIFNARSNASGTGKNYGIGMDTLSSIVSNYNDIISNGIGGVFGTGGFTDYADLATWRAGTSLDNNSVSGDPQLINPTGNSSAVDLHINSSNSTPIQAAGYNLLNVTDDYDGQSRSTLTPTDIGADAGNFVSQILYKALVTNQSVVINDPLYGNCVYFDVYLQQQNESPGPLYLGQSDFKFNFNASNFSSPVIEYILGTRQLYNSNGEITTYYNDIISTTFTNPNELDISVAYPYFFAFQAQFNLRVAKIDTTSLKHKLGTFVIHTSDLTGTFGLTWKTGESGTNVSTLARTTPWYSSPAFGTLDSVPNLSMHLAPVLLSPANNSTGINQPVTLIWNKVFTTDKYRVQISSDSEFVNIIISDSTLTDTTKTISGLNNGTKYYWRVSAKNLGSDWINSSVWNFNTSLIAPTAPVLISPLNGSINISLIPLLDWDDVLNKSISDLTNEKSILTKTNKSKNVPSIKDKLLSADFYRIQISIDSGFSTLILDSNNVLISQINIPQGRFSVNSKYYWRVNATNSGGTSPWSEVWHFTTTSNLFTSGNIVVVRIGDGSNALSSAAFPTFLDEYTTSGTFVQTISLPTVVSGSNKRLVNAGSSTSEGFLTLSPDNKYLCLAGYDADVGTASIPSTTSASVNRVVGKVDYAGNINTTTALSDAYSAGNIRGAVTSDGTAFWTSGSNAGARYAMLGSTTSIQLSTAPTTIRVVNIFDNQLYISSASSTFQGISTVGVGLPTTSGQTTTLLNGFPTSSGPSPYGFSMNSAGNIIYVADDRATASGGGIQKWTLSTGTWTLTYTLNTNLTGGCRGLTVDWSGVNPIIYATTTELPQRIVTVTDAGSTSPFTALVSSPGTNKVFRGIAFAPMAPSSNPIIDISTVSLNPFSTVVGTPSALQTYTVSGTDLDTNKLLIASPAGFEIKENGVGSFGNSLSFTPVGGIVTAKTIEVRFNPSGIGTYTGSIENSSFGATTKYVAVTGTANAVYYNIAGNVLDELTSWGTNPDGTGSNPINFTSNNQTFKVKNGSTVTINNNWVVSGTNSKVVLGDGINLINYTLPSSAALTGIIDLDSNSTITIQNTSLPTWGTINPASTIDFAQTGSFTIPVITYPNLKLTGGTKVFLGNTTTILGNLIFDGVILDAPSSSPFATIELNGDLTYLGTIVNPADGNSIILNCIKNGTQTITSNGNTARFLVLEASGTNTNVILSTTGGSTNLLLANLSGGGLSLGTGTNLTVNSNTVELVIGGKGVFTGTGTLSCDGTSSLILNTIYNASNVGTIYFANGLNSLLNLTINSGIKSFTFGSSVNVLGTLSMISGNITMGTFTSSSYRESQKTLISVDTKKEINNMRLESEKSNTIKSKNANKETNSSKTDLGISKSMTDGDNMMGIYTLTLGSGILNLGTLNWTSGKIIGSFSRWFGSGSSSGFIPFPIGTTSDSKKVEIQTNTITSGGTIKAEYLTGDPGVNNVSSLIDSGNYTIDAFSKIGKWVVASGDGLDLTGGNYDIKITAQNIIGVNIPAELRIVKRISSSDPWVLEGTHSAGDGTTAIPRATRTGLSNFSEFEIAGNLTLNPLDWHLPYNIALTAILSGHYNGTIMVPKNVRVGLHNIIPPYTLVDSQTVLLNSSGTGNPIFPAAVSGTWYYIVLRFNNGIETWSATSQRFVGSTLNYDFTSSQDQAYGNNLIHVGTKWCIISGDVNQDGAVDALDRSACWNDRNLSGYYASDLNGDGAVDALDRSIAWNNRNLSVLKPALAASPGTKQNNKGDNSSGTYDLKLDGSNAKKVIKSK